MKLTSVESQKDISKKKMKIISQKLKQAKQLQNQIKDFMKKDAFMTEEEISNEKLRTKEKIKEPLHIIDTITQLEKNPNYLNQVQIQSLKRKIERLKSNFKGNDQEERHPDLECVICLSIPKPHPGNSNLNVYSCSQHHILCQNCLEKMTRCQYHQHFMSSFHVCRSRKGKKTVNLSVSFRVWDLRT